MILKYAVSGVPLDRGHVLEAFLLLSVQTDTARPLWLPFHDYLTGNKFLRSFEKIHKRVALQTTIHQKHQRWRYTKAESLSLLLKSWRRLTEKTQRTSGTLMIPVVHLVELL